MGRLFAVLQLITVGVGMFGAAVCVGQTAAAKKSYTFQGKVEAIDVKAKSLTINGEKVEGWMEAMTMAYEVDDAGVLKTVKVGDKIKATVFDGDMVLHKVMVMPGKVGGPKAGKDAKSSK